MPELSAHANAPGVEQSDLLLPVFRGGRRAQELPTVHQAREHARSELARLAPEVARLTDPVAYPVVLAPPLDELRSALLERASRPSEPSS